MSAQLGIIFILTVLLFAPVSIVRAAGFSIVPMIQEVVLDGEQPKTVLVELTNETSASATFALSVIDFGGLDESGGIAFLGAATSQQHKYELAPWTRLETNEVTLVPGAVSPIKIFIDDPTLLAPGGHYGALILENISAARQDVPSVAVNQILSALIFVKKMGGTQYGVQLVSMGYDNSRFTFDQTWVPRFHNTGNIHVAPRGELRVTDPLHRLVYRGVLNEGSVLLMPESFRDFPIKLFSVMPVFIPGYYTVEFSYRYDGQNEQTVWSERTLFIPPLAIGGCIMLVTLVLAGWYWRRRLQRGSSLDVS